MAWLLLWRAAIAAERLDDGGKKKDAAFYEGQLKSVEFFTSCILPATLGEEVVVHGALALAASVEEA